MKNAPLLIFLLPGLLLAACASHGPAEVYAEPGEAHAILEVPGLRNFGAGPYYPALLRYIDGRGVALPGGANIGWGDEDSYVPRSADRTRLRVIPGEHRLTADINRALIVANLPGPATEREVPDHFEQKSLDARLEAGKHYVISAVVREDDYSGWYPVLLEVDARQIVDVVAEGTP